jgi:hypothetical protein
MRVRDILRASLDVVVARGLLPPYPPRVRVGLPPERQGAVWSNKQLTTAIVGCVDGTFAGNTIAWEHAASFIEDFRAGTAARRGPAAWPLPHCFGPFARVSATHAFERIATAVQASGLTPAGVNPTAYAGRFRLTDKVPMTSLPVFYGQWLARRGGYPWDDSVELALVVEAAVPTHHLPAIAATYDEPPAFISLALSAPAISLALDLARRIRVEIGPPSPPANADRAAAAPRMLVNLVAERWGLPKPFALS